MQFASSNEILGGAIALVIAVTLFYLFDLLSMYYVIKHLVAPLDSGHHMTPKASYSFTKGEKIFHLAYFGIVLPALIIAILLIWNKVFRG